MVTQVSFCFEDVRRSFFSVIGQATVVLVVKVVKCHKDQTVSCGNVDQMMLDLLILNGLVCFDLWFLF